MQKYLVIFEKSNTGYGAYVPDLPGLGVTGKTLEEAESLVYDAIEMHLEGLIANGDQIPEPAYMAETVIVKTPAA